MNFPLSTLHSPLGVRRGISLMEVLASTFVISIGLLGVLAVIPFGAFQIAKARDAEHCSNMLSAAAQDIVLGGMAKPVNWINRGSHVLKGDNNTSSTTIFDNDASDPNLNCTRFYMVDPFNTFTQTDPDHIYRIGAGLRDRSLWQERMRGQDDLLFTTYEHQRTEFTKSGGSVTNAGISSGSYTWFFMFRPEPLTGRSEYHITDSRFDMDCITPTVNVDVLGCYNRIAGSERSIPVYLSSAYLNGAKLALQSSSNENLDLANIKYIFVSWEQTTQYPTGPSTSTPITHAMGVWCKVVNAAGIQGVLATNDPDNIPDGTGGYKRVLVAVGSLPDSLPTNARALLVPGVLYHKRIQTAIQ